MYIRNYKEGPALIIEISRPARLNAIGTSIATELHSRLKEIRRQIGSTSHFYKSPICIFTRAKPVYINSKNYWIAGGDLVELRALNRKQATKYAADMASVCKIIEQLPIPVVALIDGEAIGGGIELALAADLRFCTQASRFHFKHLHVGLPTGYASAERLLELFGRSVCQKLFYLTSAIDAMQAEAMGIVHQVAQDSKELELQASEFLTSLQNLSLDAFCKQKMLFNSIRRIDVKKRLATELDAFHCAWKNPHHLAFLESFNNKNAEKNHNKSAPGKSRPLKIDNSKGSVKKVTHKSKRHKSRA